MASHVALSKANQVWKASAWSCLGGYVAEAGPKFLAFPPLPPRMHGVPQDSDEAYRYVAIGTRIGTGVLLHRCAPGPAQVHPCGHGHPPRNSVALHPPASLVLQNSLTSPFPLRPPIHECTRPTVATPPGNWWRAILPGCWSPG